MDAILDFQLEKTSHGIAPQSQLSPNAAVPFPSNLNLSNLNLSNLNLASFLIKSLPLVAATAPTQQMHQTNTNLLKELMGTNLADTLAMTNLVSI